VAHNFAAFAVTMLATSQVIVILAFAVVGAPVKSFVADWTLNTGFDVVDEIATRQMMLAQVNNFATAEPTV
jgi:hypothetical protein